jgi:F-type H+-transporting ATPase subunit delta
MAEKATIARPYARAAFDYARRANALASWSEVLTSASVIVSDPRVRKLVGNPKVSTTQIVDFIAEILGRQLDPKARNFLEEISENGRLVVLPEIAAMFETMRADVENIADVNITSAVELNDAQRQRLAAALKQRLRKEVRLHCVVDADLLGGAIVRSGDLVIDGSLRAGLERLATTMAQ